MPYLHLLAKLLLALAERVAVKELAADEGQPVEGVEAPTKGIAAVTVCPLVVTCSR